MCNIMKLYDFIRFGNASSSKGLAVLGESGSGRLPLPVSKILIVLLFIIKGSVVSDFSEDLLQAL